MPINFFELQELSKKVSLSLENTEKELFHNIFLYLIFQPKAIKKYARGLAFKGGTCLYKCYGLPRFSEDLDFDILAGKLSYKDIELLFNKYLANMLREVLGFNNVNFRINQTPTGFNVHTNIRGHAFSQTHRDCHIKFDLSSRRKLIYAVRQVEHNASMFLEKYGIEGIISLKVVDPKEIFAEKILAILDKLFISGQRDEARDLFDVYILLLRGYICKIDDIKKKLPEDKKDVFSLKNFSDSLYKTAKSKEWDMMVNQLIIEPKLKEFGMSIKTIDFGRVAKFVIERLTNAFF